MRVAIGVLLLATFGAAAAPKAGSFAVGVLRRDGIVIPVAAWNGKSWSDDWPNPADPGKLVVPINVPSVPSGWWGPTGPLETWQAWVGTRPPADVHVLQPDWVKAFCARQVGLRTDYRPAEPPPPFDVEPYPKDGIVVSPPWPVERIEIVRTTGPDPAAIASVLTDEFNRAERETAGRFSHPANASVREAFTPTIEAMYAHGGEPRAYYLEATREYETAVSHECLAIAFGTGWFVRENGKFRSLAMAVDLLDCERHGASYMQPFGVVRIGTRLFWIAQFSSIDRERYAIIEPKAKAVDAVVNAWGGGC